MSLLWLLGLSSGHSPDWATIVAVLSTMVFLALASLYFLGTSTQ